MDIQNFYAVLLELGTAWIVHQVVSEEEAQRVEVHIHSLEGGQFPCPLCERHFSACDFSSLRTWRHLDTCGKKTLLLARLPIVECSVHGRQCSHPPWGDKESPLTRAFLQLLADLAEYLGDTLRAAHALRVQPVLASQAQRSMARQSNEAGKRPAGDLRSGSQEAGGSPARQPSLFDQNDMSFANLGIQAFRKMELQKAVDFLQKHRTLYPNGLDVTSRLDIADFLLRGIQGAPADQLEQSGYMCRLWTSFEDYVKSGHPGREAVVNEVKGAFFARVIETVERCSPAGSSTLPGNFSMGYILLQAGRYEEAIRSLQDSISKTPHDAALHGYLGEAFRLRGELKVARQCYREACLIDTAGLDWRLIQDEDINELKQDLFLIYGPDTELALAWLPSYARANGLFERKVVRLHDGLKQMIDEYLAMEKALNEKQSPILAAKLFFRGIILCENEEFLKFIKTVDPVRIRRAMKQANPNLFADFLEMIARGAGSPKKARNH
ncbi:MAG: tetratricopeptide repeat protein [Syntrophobacteraceae bacterium]